MVVIREDLFALSMLCYVLIITHGCCRVFRLASVLFALDVVAHKRYNDRYMTPRLIYIRSVIIYQLRK